MSTLPEPNLEMLREMMGAPDLANPWSEETFEESPFVRPSLLEAAGAQSCC
jgi:hypothetical protein